MQASIVPRHVSQSVGLSPSSRVILSNLSVPHFPTRLRFIPFQPGTQIPDSSTNLDSWIHLGHPQYRPTLVWGSPASFGLSSLGGGGGLWEKKGRGKWWEKGWWTRHGVIIGKWGDGWGMGWKPWGIWGRKGISYNHRDNLIMYSPMIPKIAENKIPYNFQTGICQNLLL